MRWDGTLISARKSRKYEDYLLSRWGQGCRNAALLYRELRGMGFRGANCSVRAYIAHLRQSTANGSAACPRKNRAKAVSPRVLRWLLARKREELDQDGQAQLDQLLAISEEVRSVYTSKTRKTPLDVYKGKTMSQYMIAFAGILVAAALALDGLLHAYWATGQIWPAR